MLPRSQRLSVEQFNAVMEKGRVTHSSLFLIRSLQTDEETRVSAVAPQKIVKKATARTTLRREMYDAIKPFMDFIKPGVHAAVFAKPTALDLSSEAMTAGMKEIFVKAGLFK